MITDKDKNMLKEVLTKLIGITIVATGRAIKTHNLKIFDSNNFEITPEQYVVLNTLNEEGTFYQKELGEKLYKDKANITRLLSILEEKDLIKKNSQIENEKQVNKVKITDKGVDVRAKITPVIDSARREYVQDITEDELYTCIKVLQKIQENLSRKL